MLRVTRAILASIFLSALVLPTSANAANDCPDSWGKTVPEISYKSKVIKVGNLDKELWTVNSIPIAANPEKNPLLTRINQGMISGDVVFEAVIESASNPLFENTVVFTAGIRDQDAYSLNNRGLRNGNLIRYKFSIRARNCAPITLFSNSVVFNGATESPIGVDTYLGLGNPAQNTKLNFEEEDSIKLALSSLKSSLSSVKLSQQLKIPVINVGNGLARRSIRVLPLDDKCLVNLKVSGHITFNSTVCALGIYLPVNLYKTQPTQTWMFVEKVVVWPVVNPSPSSSPIGSAAPTMIATPSPKPSPTIKCKQEKTIYLVLGSKCPKGLTKI